MLTLKINVILSIEVDSKCAQNKITNIETFVSPTTTSYVSVRHLSDTASQQEILHL